MPGPLKLMGAEVKRKEDPRLITGSSTYTTDITLPGMHYVAFVRSPHPHARIRSIDTSVAAKRPGVFAVLTGRDLVGKVAPVPLASGSAGGGASSGAPGRQHHVLSTDLVRHVGEAVAAVVAPSEALAVDAAAEVRVDWEPLPAVVDPFQAMAAGAPQLFADAPRNIQHEDQTSA